MGDAGRVHQRRQCGRGGADLPGKGEPELSRISNYQPFIRGQIQFRCVLIFEQDQYQSWGGCQLLISSAYLPDLNTDTDNESQ